MKHETTKQCETKNNNNEHWEMLSNEKTKNMMREKTNKQQQNITTDENMKKHKT